MRTGRPRKSADQKRLNGTAQPCRIVASDEAAPRLTAPLEYVPDVPAHLQTHEHAAAQWRWLAPLLVRAKTLAEQDLNTLANFCMVQAQIVRAALGEIPEPRGIHAQFKQYASALGLAPAWRVAKVWGEADKPSANPFEQYKIN